MNWTIVWFITNFVFVAALLTSLFTHRFYTIAKLEGAEEDRLIQLKRRRDIARITAIVFFIAMAVSFITNMKLEG